MNHVAYSLDESLGIRCNDTSAQEVYFNAINSITYEVELRCANMHGFSNLSEVMTVRPQGPPSKPQKIWIVHRDDHKVTLAWQRPFNDGGHSISKYHLRAIPVGRRGANCEQSCHQQQNEMKPPPDYTSMSPQEWDELLKSPAITGVQVYEDKVNIDEFLEDESTNDTNSSNSTSSEYSSSPCVRIKFAKFTDEGGATCQPVCWFIQSGCTFEVYATDEITSESKPFMTGSVIKNMISANTMGQGVYYGPIESHVAMQQERIEWIGSDGKKTWFALPRAHKQFKYPIYSVLALRIWGSWNNYQVGLPMSKNNGLLHRKMNDTF